MKGLHADFWAVFQMSRGKGNFVTRVLAGILEETAKGPGPQNPVPKRLSDFPSGYNMSEEEKNLRRLLSLLFRRGLATALLVVVVTGCSGTAPSVKVENVWARPASAGVGNPSGNGMNGEPAGGHMNSASGGSGMGSASGNAAMGSTSAIYMILTNPGQEPDTLVAARTDVAEKVELHRTTVTNDVMRMEPVEFIEVPAKGQVALKRGDLHIMLMGLKRELAAGDKFKAVLVMKKAGEIPIEVEVRNP